MSTRPSRPFTARPRHPITGRQFVVRARTAGELAAILQRIESLREELRVRRALTKPGQPPGIDEVDRELRVLEHGKITLEHATRSYEARPDLSPDTIEAAHSFRRSAGAPLMHLAIDALDARTVSQWIERLRARMLPNTVDRYWRQLRSIVRHAAERGWIGRAPWGAYRPILRDRKPRLREAARTVEELSRILDAARTFDITRDRALFGPAGVFAYEPGAAPAVPSAVEAMIAVAALLGLRQLELRRLVWNDVAPASREVSFVESKRPHGHPSRAILQAVPEVFEILERYRFRLQNAGFYRVDGPVFVDPRSTPDNPRAYASREVLTRRDLRAVVAGAGIVRVGAWSAHSLRDTFVTLESVARGGDLAGVSERSRHASIAALVRYLRSRSRSAAEPGFRLEGAGEHPGLAHAPALPRHRSPRTGGEPVSRPSAVQRRTTTKTRPP